MIQRMPIPDPKSWKGLNVSIEDAKAALVEFASKRGATILAEPREPRWRFNDNWAFYATIDVPDGQSRWTACGGNGGTRCVLYRGKRHVGFSRWTGRWVILGIR